jgi:hypothetical protein
MQSTAIIFVIFLFYGIVSVAILIVVLHIGRALYPSWRGDCLGAQGYDLFNFTSACRLSGGPFTSPTLNPGKSFEQTLDNRVAKRYHSVIKHHFASKTSSGQPTFASRKEAGVKSGDDADVCPSTKVK